MLEILPLILLLDSLVIGIIVAVLIPAVVFLFLVGHAMWQEKTGGFKALAQKAPQLQLFAEWINDKGERELLPLAEVQELQKARRLAREAELDDQMDRYADGMPFTIGGKNG